MQIREGQTDLVIQSEQTVVDENHEANRSEITEPIDTPQF